ncbi:related to MRPL32 - mitochondrial ribosomal protein of the large subunit [Melanopsichium pennsylvanicum]|uniref:Large ribosomal subunit protein bL32m n=1 Tax=Melanopsichium pennsylvanicum TaxID=63383 RepID=A0AAJ4XPK5_9BASI|nr:related to MRPL32 - mitochondrial ribosomal protein of the large subunit [Melanopsichium pennsylvanicum]
MFLSTSRNAAAQLRLTLSIRGGESTPLFRFCLPALLTPALDVPSSSKTTTSSSSSSSSSSQNGTFLTPAFALSPNMPASVAVETQNAALEGSSSSSWLNGGGSGDGFLIGLWDGFLRAVPKSKVSHSRKSMRAANKGLKDRVDLVHCSGCGKPKAQHHICGFCYAELNRARKVALANNENAASSSSAQNQSDV